ncbi:hypothetical protein EW146_g5051 [Bondarzewia mesenterica]|uniref:Ricin B lectin domain-containing protein n=1 Tax=Bondarzewia mesenterica TaxID=1095465 RepID=A0A4S4LSL2_9AGAM|nr:hypothetical protein EW146_g5051 [Bondarzewia mesenterica]
MGIERGATYSLVNVKSGTALDLSGADGRSIIGYGFHGHGNQQWVLEQPNGSEWTFRSVETGKYLDIDGEPGNGTLIVASDYPREWDIWPDEQDDSVYRIFIHNTSYNVDLSDHGNPNPGTPVTLWSKWEGTNQTWRFERA